MFRFAQHDKGVLKRTRHADLRSEKIQARIRIGLSSIGQVLVKRSDVYFPMIVDAVRDAGSRQNVERKILALSAGNFRMTVDPARADAARKIRNEPAAGSNKVIAHAEIESEIMVLNSTKNRLCHRADVELIVATQPGVMDNSPTNPRRQKFRADFVTLGRIDRAK